MMFRINGNMDRLKEVYFDDKESNNAVLSYLEYKGIILSGNKSKCKGSIKKGYIEVYENNQLKATLIEV